MSGDEKDLSRLVAKPAVRQRISQFGHRMRATKATGVHIVPSFTLNRIRSDYYGSGFYVLGSTSQGRLKSPNTLYLRIQGGRILVTNDQPAQDL